ncbi:ubiquinone biosynthesis protein [Lasius niger]|uniref:Ubiquinone biosynthesis protein n=1 Tax=Lasius niger TaxID=67767 RepID=A0A0J7KNC3_LASNI|nr:ubiquinone biosynthesis protein [Lasius niger]
MAGFHEQLGQPGGRRRDHRMPLIVRQDHVLETSSNSEYAVVVEEGAQLRERATLSDGAVGGDDCDFGSVVQLLHYAEPLEQCFIQFVRLERR